MLTSEITKENLNKMVVRFYAKIINDDVVGPFFIEKLGDNLNNNMWKPHIELLTNFWASIALGDQNYRGNPLAPHLQIGGLERATFDQWLNLFFETLESIYEPHVANLFKERSTIIAGNFMRNLRIA
ncbi:group III truncated hemoglobin [Sulfurimonas sp.]|uniref:group III truncated hemoglobin n=1 Tax=Sulfurimonas sp. TaxID=2022749 RepID=UPI003561F3D3